MVVINPINFPADLEIQVLPLSNENDTPLGGLFSMHSHRSWEWIRGHYPVPVYQFEETEGYLKTGARANLVRGNIIIEVPDDTTFPAGAHFRQMG
jgi:hypothetical protein